MITSGQVRTIDLAWYEGLAAWQPLHTISGFHDLAGPPPMIGASVAHAQAQYHHVSTVKFVIFSICSLGLYHIYWFYKNWAYVRDRDVLSISPFWRGVFGVIWCHPLAKDVSETRGQLNQSMAAVVGLAYFGLTLAARLPDPYWLVTLFSFVPLLYIVRQINLINEERSARGPHYSRFSIWSILLCLFGSLVLALALFGTLVPTPSTKVIAAEEMPQKDIGFLRSEKIIGATEQILYFYSTGILSIKDEGNILTDERVISYYSDDEERFIDSATFDKIEDIDVTYSDSSLVDTEVTVYVKEGEEFYLSLSNEEGKDRAFVDKLMSLWKAKQPPQ